MSKKNATNGNVYHLIDTCSIIDYLEKGGKIANSLYSVSGVVHELIKRVPYRKEDFVEQIGRQYEGTLYNSTLSWDAYNLSYTNGANMYGMTNSIISDLEIKNEGNQLADPFRNEKVKVNKGNINLELALLSESLEGGLEGDLERGIAKLMSDNSDFKNLSDVDKQLYFTALKLYEKGSNVIVVTKDKALMNCVNLIEPAYLAYKQKRDKVCVRPNYTSKNVKAVKLEDVCFQ